LNLELEFYDIKNGMFNAFTTNDLTFLNQEQSNIFEKKIPESGLMQKTARSEALEGYFVN